MTTKKSPLPTPPTSIGLSRRLIIVFVLLILSVVVLFLFFLTHYSPKPITQPASTVTAPMDQSASSAQIAKIKQAGPYSVDIDNNAIDGNHYKTTYSVTNSTPTANTSVNLQDKSLFQEGGNAQIAVYHAPMAAPDPTRFQANYHPSFVSTTAPTAITPPTVNAYKAQNMQTEKVAFLKQANKTTKDYLTSSLQPPLSPYEINAGTIIPATLMTGINSTLPGTLIAKVRRDVFDSVSGNDVLIPQGTTLIGDYDSQIAYGQSRVLIVWSRLIFPNGSSFDLHGMPGADLTGMAGLHDIVDHHYFRLFGSALLMSVFGAAGQLSQPHSNSSQPTTSQILYAAIGQQLSQTAMQLMEKNLNIQPTIKIRPGASFNVLLTRDMVLPGPYRF